MAKTQPSQRGQPVARPRTRRRLFQPIGTWTPAVDCSDRRAPGLRQTADDWRCVQWTRLTGTRSSEEQVEQPLRGCRPREERNPGIHQVSSRKGVLTHPSMEAIQADSLIELFRHLFPSANDRDDPSTGPPSSDALRFPSCF